MTTKTKSKEPKNKVEPKPKPTGKPKPKAGSVSAKNGARGTRSRGRKPIAKASEAKRLPPGALADLVVGYMREHEEGLPLGPGPIAKGLGRSAGAVSNSLERMADADGPVRRAKKKPRLYDLKEEKPADHAEGA